MHRATIRILGIIALLSVASTSGCSQTQNQPATRVFRKPVPASLQADIESHLQKLVRARPLSSGEQSEVSSAVEALNLKYPAMADRPRQTIQRFDAACIPVIAPLLLSPDAVTRQKGVTALGYLVRPRERITNDYAATEAALMVLFRRSQLDNDAKVRLMATGSLWSIGAARFPNVPNEVKEALEDAASDPDQQVRDKAIRGQRLLRLTPVDSQP